MPTIFITGASSGVGHATAKLFAANGWHVIATMRTPADTPDLALLPGITVLPLDITNQAQIQATTAQALALGEVDVVFNNAGYMLTGPLEGTTDAQLERQIETDLLGAIRVTQAFLPHFRARRQGLFLITTGLVAWAPHPFMSVYAATKGALEAWAGSMYFELRRFSIGIKTLLPGLIETKFASKSDLTQQPAYAESLGKVMQMFTGPDAEKGNSPEEIAQVAWEAATDGKDQVQYVAGTDGKQRYQQFQELGPEALRKTLDHQYFG